jgi:hypothetical protein
MGSRLGSQRCQSASGNAASSLLCLGLTEGSTNQHSLPRGTHQHQRLVLCSASRRHWLPRHHRPDSSLRPPCIRVQTVISEHVNFADWRESTCHILRTWLWLNQGDQSDFSAETQADEGPTNQRITLNVNMTPSNARLPATLAPCASVSIDTALLRSVARWCTNAKRS